MKMQEKCLPCIINQAIKVADMVGLIEKDNLLKKVFAYLSKADYQNATTPELIGQIFSLLKEETGNTDPYYETRNKYNKMFLDIIPDFEKQIDQSEDTFLMAIKYAIIGNIIDFNPIHNTLLSEVLESFDQMKNDDLAIDHSKHLMEDIRTAESILYLGDNCGEICLDKILVKKIREQNSSCKIFFSTRGRAVVNDSIEEDAYYVGIDEYATVINNGDDSLGTVLHRTSDEFRAIYQHADVIIAKGQANYECLSTQTENIYFLLMTKCEVIAQDINTPEKRMICMNRKYQFH